MEKVIDCVDFNKEFPESFDWNLIDSLKITPIAVDITKKIEDDLMTKERNLVPGLRKALIIIANETGIYQ